MILQTDTYFPEEIRRYGCYFMSLVFLASQKASRSFSKSDVLFFYDYFVENGWMKPSCYILDPGAILRYLNLPVDYEGKREGHAPCCRGEYEILCFRRSYISGGEAVSYTHFVTGDGHGHVAYDPVGMSNAVKKGHLESKRIFLRRG